MNLLPSQLAFFFQNKTTRKNLILLGKFVILLLLVISTYSVLFHLLMLYEGRDFSWITGIYWTLTVMSTLGFGDITFHSDLGLLFTILVLGSGVFLLLIMLPFTFIQFFYAPWLEAQEKVRTPRELPETTSNHIIITSLDPITEKLISKLGRRHLDYVLVVDDTQRASELHDSGYRVLVGEIDDPETFRKLRVEQSALVVATNDDLTNTSISFTIRQITGEVPIVVSADNGHSLDILQFPGNTKVFQFARMLGRAMAERTFGLGRSVNVVSQFGSLQIAEVATVQTSLAGKMLAEMQIPKNTGVMVAGLWDKGHFEMVEPLVPIKKGSLLLLAGTSENLCHFEAQYVLAEKQYGPESPVVILGGGRVGLAAAEVLAESSIRYRLVEKRKPETIAVDHVIHGDAADIKILEEAGIMAARTVIVTTHNDAMNIYLTFYCRQLRPDVQIISRATTERSVAKLHMAGADLVLSYGSMGANAIVNIMQRDEISMFTEGLNIFSRPMPQSLVGKPLYDSRIREKSGCLVIGLRTAKGLVVSPDSTSLLQREDELILIGNTLAEQRFLDEF